MIDFHPQEPVMMAFSNRPQDGEERKAGGHSSDEEDVANLVNELEADPFSPFTLGGNNVAAVRG